MTLSFVSVNFKEDRWSNVCRQVYSSVVFKNSKGDYYRFSVGVVTVYFRPEVFCLVFHFLDQTRPKPKVCNPKGEDNYSVHN